MVLGKKLNGGPKKVLGMPIPGTGSGLSGVAKQVKKSGKQAKKVGKQIGELTEEVRAARKKGKCTKNDRRPVHSCLDRLSGNCPRIFRYRRSQGTHRG